jgi:hypothetical protein
MVPVPTTGRERAILLFSRSGDIGRLGKSEVGHNGASIAPGGANGNGQETGA